MRSQRPLSGNVRLLMRKISGRRAYCCARFARCVREASIQHCGTKDETEWAVPSFYHLYYCPFCGKFIKGRGWGTYEKKYPPSRAGQSNSTLQRTGARVARPGR